MCAIRFVTTQMLEWFKTTICAAIKPCAVAGPALGGRPVELKMLLRTRLGLSDASDRREETGWEERSNEWNQQEEEVEYGRDDWSC
jgi:hypothetical protein